MTYVYLQFSNLEGFAEYLKKREITQYGMVERYLRRQELEKYFLRFTAKDKDDETIIVCDVTFHKGLYASFDKEGYKKAFEEVMKEKVVLDGLSMIEAEFRITEEEYFKR